MQGNYTVKGLHMGRLPKGSDLLLGLTDLVKERGITVGFLYAIGALESARFAYYLQDSKGYETICVDKALEILCLIGNISQKEGEPFVHAHITLSDEEKVWGGHLVEGCKVFALEYQILELEGPTLNRVFDSETGLYLWK
jgi:predicted DNA-binding protein with PD1-like motif